MYIINHFIWDEINRLHIAKHNVTEDEAEEATTYHKRYMRHAWDERYSVFGRTGAGRYLFVAIDYYRDKKAARVATARDLNDKEKNYYKGR